MWNASNQNQANLEGKMYMFGQSITYLASHHPILLAKFKIAISSSRGPKQGKPTLAALQAQS
jgi:hypothetical protein